MGNLLVRGIHQDGQPFEARIVAGTATNHRGQDNSVVVQVCHGERQYRRRFSSWIWAQIRLTERCSRVDDWHGPEFVHGERR